MTFIKSLLQFIGRDPKPLAKDYSILQVDMHSHLLPGIDDGVKTLPEAVAMVSKLVQLGFQKLITTPHIMTGGYDNNPTIIREKLLMLRDAISETDMDIQIEAAAEYYLDESFEHWLSEKEELLTFGNNYLLFELSTSTRPSNLEQVIFDLTLAGYKPVLAHPERYFYLHDPKMDQFKQLKESGICFQMNLVSLTGVYTERVKSVARKMIDMDLVDFVGTDLHNKKHHKLLLDGLKDSYMYTILNSENLLNKKLM